MKWLDVSNKVEHRVYSRECSDISQCSLRNTTIAEILLSEKNLWYGHKFY